MSLLLWYPFTQDGYNRGAIEGNHLSPTLNNTGILGKCGLANKVTLGTNLDLGGNYSPLNTSSTMTAWVKMNLDECKAVIASTSVSSSANTPTSCVIGSTSYGGLGICWQSNNIYNGGNRAELSFIRLFGYTRGTNSSGSAVQVTTTAKNITFGKWHHVALVTNQATKTITFYFDGSFVSENSYSSMAAISAGRPFGLNRNQVNGGNGPGALLPIYYNDVRFYDEVLSVKEIRELSKALIVHYTFNDIANEATTNLITSLTKGGQTTVDNTLGTVTTSGVSADTYFKLNLSEPMVEGETYTIQCVGENLPGGEYFRFPIGAQSNTSLPFLIYNGLNTYTFVANATAAGNTSVMMDDNYRGAYPNQCVFSHFQLEKKDHATPYVNGSRASGYYYDESGNGYDANQIDMKYTANTNNGTTAAKFNGSTSCLEVPFIRSDLFKTPYTLSFWVNPDDNDRAVYFGDHQLSGGVSMNFERKTGGQFRYYHAGNPDITINLTTPVGEWTMVTVTSDNTTLRFYKNGVEVPSSAYTFTPTITKNSGVMRIGRDSRSDYTSLAGRMSDFRFYGTALSAADVLELYEGKASVDKTHNVFTNEIIEQNEVANMVNLGSWEQGGVQDASGTDANNMNNRVRTKYIPVLPNTPYYFKAAAGWDIRGVHFYKKDNTWISYSTIGSSGVRTTPVDCYYVRFVVQSDSASANVLIANIATFEPVMVPGSTAITSGMAADTDVQVTKTYQIKTKDICENHDAGFFKDGTASGNRFHEI